jgi:hypothetical protein
LLLLHCLSPLLDGVLQCQQGGEGSVAAVVLVVTLCLHAAIR